MAVDYDLYQADLQSSLQPILVFINGLSQDPRSQSLTHSQQQYVNDIWAIKKLRQGSARHLGNVQDVPMPKSKFVGHDQLKRFAALMHGLEPEVMRQQLSQLRIGDTASLQGEQDEVDELRRNAMAIDAELAKGLRHRGGHDFSETHVQENGQIHQGNRVNPGFEGALPYFSHIYRKQTATGNGRIIQGDQYGNTKDINGRIHQGSQYSDNTGNIRRPTTPSNDQNQPGDHRSVDL
ncbi:hypothetical protein LQW54_012356 [Pestalotiopsis sp. IQ-011]